MKTCPKCAEDVQDKAKVCKHCGYKFKLHEGGAFGCGAAFVVGLAIFLVYAASDKKPDDETPAASPLATVQPGSVNEQAVDDLLDNHPWSYHFETDNMTSKKAVYALDSSTNSVDFGFPYSGGSTLLLELRRHPRMGTDAFIQVSKGQMDCSVEGCSLTVRFDDGKPQRFTGIEPEDGSIETLFVTPASRFITKLRHSKSVIIEVPFYQEGRRQFTFNTKGLHWPPNKYDL